MCVNINVLNGDITELNFNVDAIVNATNRHLKSGGELNTLITKKAGLRVLEECQSIISKYGVLDVSDTVVTSAGELNADYIIHVVGPYVHNKYVNDIAKTSLYNCYMNSLNEANRLGLKSIAFPNISTGIMGYPKEDAVLIVALVLKDYLDRKTDDMTLEDIYFVCYDEDNYNLYMEHLYNLLDEKEVDIESPLAMFEFLIVDNSKNTLERLNYIESVQDSYDYSKVTNLVILPEDKNIKGMLVNIVELCSYLSLNNSLIMTVGSAEFLLSEFKEILEFNNSELVMFSVNNPRGKIIMSNFSNYVSNVVSFLSKDHSLNLWDLESTTIDDLYTNDFDFEGCSADDEDIDYDFSDIDSDINDFNLDSDMSLSNYVDISHLIPLISKTLKDVGVMYKISLIIGDKEQIVIEKI